MLLLLILVHLALKTILLISLSYYNYILLKQLIQSMKSNIKLILLVLVCLKQLSCQNDNNTTSTTSNNSIIGEWLRSDYLVDTSTEYKLFFYEDNANGLITEQLTTQAGIISSANPFTWTLNEAELVITEQNGTETITSVQFLENGNLILENFSTLEFIRQ